MADTSALDAQLMAVGPQDLHLDQNPNHSFFHDEVRRHTPFAQVEYYESLMPTLATPGQALTYTMELVGDVCDTMNLVVTGRPPATDDLDVAVTSPFDRLQLFCNGQLVHDVDDATYNMMAAVLEPPRRSEPLVERRPDGSVRVYVPIRWKILLPVIAFVCQFGVTMTLSSSWLAFDDVQFMYTTAFLSPEERVSFLNNDTRILYDQYDCLNVSNAVFGNDMTAMYKTSLNVDLNSLQSETKCIMFGVQEDFGYGACNPYVDVVDTVALVLGGINITNFMPDGQVMLLQRYQYTEGGNTRDAQPLYLFTFALNPASPSPSGTVSMAKYSKKSLALTFTRTGSFHVRLCAISFNCIQVANRQLRVIYGP